MEKENLLFERLREYKDSEVYPFHMPGHKRCKNEFTAEFGNPYELDLTEIAGFDNLHHPEGILKESMEWAAKVYGADKTYYLVNGSSSGILSGICGICSPKGKILMSRNCHKSAYHGVILKNLQVQYIYPQIIEKLWITGGISQKDVEKALEENPDAEAVLIVSPTYEGIVSDVRAIAETVHRRKIPLIVDEAHGAHFSFDRRKEKRLFPMSALDCGADVVIQSLHKTLPSFTQTAVLHVRKEYVDCKRLEWYLQVFQSSSPSYLLMAGIERCIFEMDRKGEDYYQKLEENLHKLRNTLSRLKALHLMNESVIGHFGVYHLDPSKLVISCRGTCLSGEKLGKWLRKKYHLEPEMCGPDYILAIATCFDTEEGMNRLEEALLEIDKKIVEILPKEKEYLREDRSNKENFWPNEVPDICMTLTEAREREGKRIRISDSEGRISLEFIYLYPPGIPILAPGERISQNIISQVNSYKKMGLPVQGMEDPEAEYLMVCTEE